jgi:hypothetical protein
VCLKLEGSFFDLVEKLTVFQENQSTRRRSRNDEESGKRAQMKKKTSKDTWNSGVNGKVPSTFEVQK